MRRQTNSRILGSQSSQRKASLNNQESNTSEERIWSPDAVVACESRHGAYMGRQARKPVSVMEAGDGERPTPEQGPSPKLAEKKKALCSVAGKVPK